MTIEEALQQFIPAQPAVSVLIGARLYPGVKIPDDATYPLLGFSCTSGSWERAIGGPTDTGHPIFRFDSWGKTYAQVVALDTALRQAIDGYTGMMGTVDVQAVMGQDDTEDDYDPPPGTKLFRRSTSYEVWYREAR